MKSLLQVTLTIHGSAPRRIEFGESALIGSGRAADVRVVDPELAPVHLRILRDGNAVIAIALAPGVLLDGAALGVDTPRDCTGVPILLGPVHIVAVLSDGANLVAGRARTESLARELVRDLLGGDALPHPEFAPELTVEAGPVAGQRFALPRSDARVVVGRGDASTWVLFDPDLSRMHAAFEHRHDGVWVTDLESKNGTHIGGVAAPTHGPGLIVPDGARIVLGETILRYRDPAAVLLVELEDRLRGGNRHQAETHTRVGAAPEIDIPPPVLTPVSQPGTRWPVLAAGLIALAAVGLLAALFANS